MKKYDINFPIAGVLHFYEIEAENKQEAIDKCYDLVSETEDPIREFDGEWDMYERFAEGNIMNVSNNRIDIQECE